MQVQINLTLPLSASDWNKLTQLQAISVLGPLKIGKMDKKISSYIESLSGNTIDQIETKNDEPLLAEEVSEDQKAILDAALEKTHQSGETMLLDTLSLMGVGKKKPSVRELLLHHMTERGGVSSRQEAIEYVCSILTDKARHRVEKGCDAAAYQINIVRDLGIWKLPNAAV